MLLGFPEIGAGGEEQEDDNVETSKLVQEMNRKKKKSGGFQAMGLSQDVFKGVIKKGYKVPTPIQRKTIPLILDGKDVVAMARTGSGKTACFLLPLFQKLKCRSAKTGARALVLSPTRELALQTLKFAKELGKYTGLRYECVLGGDAMEKQFAAIHENPDVIFATPGRFVHLCVEMGLKLNSVEYVVFDEADRLFEMGFGEQLREILGRLPESRQTVLFSATLPKLLVDFAKAGLCDPTLIRLDVETKIPDTLKLAFFHSRGEMKDACLLYLLKDLIEADQQTVIFTATRHHVEYLQILLELANIPATFIYSNLDPAARKINVAKFASKKVNVMVVTDIAARGIDIPMLDNVINYHFPAKSKLFIHRVGRVARAGREGTAYSFVGLDEVPYYIDLQLFLGGSPDIVPLNPDKGLDWHRLLGRVPQTVNENYSDQMNEWLGGNADLQKARKTAENGYKQYLKSRPGASVESVKRSKELKDAMIGDHPLLRTETTEMDKKQANILEQMKNFRPKSTIFEIGNTTKNKDIIDVMNVKRRKHEDVIEAAAKRRKIDEKVPEAPDERISLAKSTEDDIEKAFETVVKGSKAKQKSNEFKKKKKEWKKDENFISYEPSDKHTEAGFSLDSGFSAQASNAVLDLTADEDNEMRRKKGIIRWDNKTKKYVKVQDDKKRIKTESGVYISATYKTNRYEKWKERSKLAQQDEDADSDNDNKKPNRRPLPANHPAMQKARNAVPKHRTKGIRQEIRRPEQILKQRRDKEKREERMARAKKRKASKQKKR
eukprot:TRINITY_DN1417_c0_g1_i8.p1 TRINITY_DN1417_c0_g1~~TRINITY_DN1417_c0_g1_i8.p1  ORF type:complete len:778 (-),score=244.97 TRINITY_DN1417_c0_g1_i8:52-2385(-)